MSSKDWPWSRSPASSPHTLVSARTPVIVTLQQLECFFFLKDFILPFSLPSQSCLSATLTYAHTNTHTRILSNFHLGFIPNVISPEKPSLTLHYATAQQIMGPDFKLWVPFTACFQYIYLCDYLSSISSTRVGTVLIIVFPESSGIPAQNMHLTAIH